MQRKEGETSKERRRKQHLHRPKTNNTARARGKQQNQSNIHITEITTPSFELKQRREDKAVQIEQRSRRIYHRWKFRSLYSKRRREDVVANRRCDIDGKQWGGEIWQNPPNENRPQQPHQRESRHPRQTKTQWKPQLQSPQDGSTSGHRRSLISPEKFCFQNSSLSSSKLSRGRSRTIELITSVNHRPQTPKLLISTNRWDIRSGPNCREKSNRRGPMNEEYKGVPLTMAVR